MDKPQVKTIPESVSKIIIHTGNIINLNDLKKSVGKTSTDELTESLNSTLTKWDLSEVVEDTGTMKIGCKHQNCGVKLNTEDRKDLKVSMKIFLNTFQKSALREAFEETLHELELTCVESLILMNPPAQTEDEHSLSKFQELWSEMELLVTEGKVVYIGVSDLDTDMFSKLHQMAKVKPSIIQINLSTCCVVPPELSAYAKANDIQLFTHSDPRDLLPQASLIQTLQMQVSGSADCWKPYWILRYQVEVRCRGVLQNKGYLLCTKKEDS